MTEFDASPDEGEGLLARFHRRLSHMDAIRVEGRVAQIVGLVVESDGPAARMGEVCLIAADSNTPSVAAEVVATGKPLTVAVGPALLGRVLDGLGRPIDGGPPLRGLPRVPVEASPPNPLLRARIRQPLPLGVRAMDGLLTCGRGQRLGIFAGSGVGKSTTLGMIARNTEAQLNVICLVGERGREVRDFLERDLGPEGLTRSVVVVATSDQPALQRIKCALVATAIAEHFRDQGQDVMLMMDSVTRFAMAQREVGLAIGEPPATKGYTPSVFALLPRLLERAGTGASGSITGLYTVLVEADDFNEPISDAVRGILDGHVILSRDLAAQNHYPAIDILASVSRVMPEITDDRHRKAAGWLREALATYKNAQDLINIGAYQRGSNPQIDVAMELHETLTRYLQQAVDEVVPYPEALAGLQAIFEPFFAAEAAQGRMH